MRRRNERAIIIFCMLFLILQVGLYMYTFPLSLSPRSEDWAAFSTFFGLSLSFVSALFIYLTYRSQTTMSSVLQFESIFFQWYQQHREVYNGLKVQVSDFSNKEVIPFIGRINADTDIDSLEMEEKSAATRVIMPYYRSLYQLMKYIHQNEIVDSYEQKKKYVDIVQSQMTDSEYLVVLYFMLTDSNKSRKDKFDRYSTKKKEMSWMAFANKYHLFKNIYYSSSNANFDGFVAFMQKSFPDTAESFHFLR